MPALLATGTDAVEDDFRVADGVFFADAQRRDERWWDLGLFEAFDFAAAFADEVGVVVDGFVGIAAAEGVAPDAVFPADAVSDALGGEGVEGAVDGDGVGFWGEFFEYFDGAERAGGAA